LNLLLSVRLSEPGKNFHSYFLYEIGYNRDVDFSSGIKKIAVGFNAQGASDFEAGWNKQTPTQAAIANAGQSAARGISNAWGALKGAVTPKAPSPPPAAPSNVSSGQSISSRINAFQ
jgi:hypothetical protein